MVKNPIRIIIRGFYGMLMTQIPVATQIYTDLKEDLKRVIKNTI